MGQGRLAMERTPGLRVARGGAGDPPHVRQRQRRLLLVPLGADVRVQLRRGRQRPLPRQQRALRVRADERGADGGQLGPREVHLRQLRRRLLCRLPDGDAGELDQRGIHVLGRRPPRCGRHGLLAARAQGRLRPGQPRARGHDQVHCGGGGQGPRAQGSQDDQAGAASSGCGRRPRGDGLAAAAGAVPPVAPAAGQGALRGALEHHHDALHCPQHGHSLNGHLPRK
mmetsp:Transcript_10077/g.16289  ORF Transcript_10077/g.16289 Transcript_10077/m.16289 type:complete len:226 (+) Transcript_10077:94-771(+)